MMAPPKFPADRKRSYVDIEKEARRARQLMKFDEVEPIPSMALFERLAVLRTGARLEIPTTYSVQTLVAGVEAECRYQREQRLVEVVLTESTYAELEEDSPRARFSVAHETGHVVQHCAELIRLARIPRVAVALMRGNYASLRAYEDVEWQANAFAGAYLAPAKALRRLEVEQRLTVPEISRRFGISPPAATKRLDTYNQKRRILIG